MARRTTGIKKSPLKEKRVIIIGGLGFIGSNVARRCIQDGAVVTVVSNHDAPQQIDTFNLSGLEDKFEFIPGDVREKSFIELLVRGQDYIFNFAGQADHNRALEDPRLDNALNCIGHINVLMACKQFNPKAILAYPGSRLQYGRVTKIPVKEDHPRQPLSTYAIHKNVAEQYYQTFSHHYGIRSVCFRITNPYGPRAQMHYAGHGIVNWFIRQTLDGQPLTIFGDGSQLRDYIYIDDLVNGLLAAMATESCYGQVYNLGSGQGTAFVDMARLVTQSVGQGEVKFVPWPKQYDHYETGDFVSDSTALAAAAQWQPNYTLAEGIQATVDYYRQHRHHYW